MKKKEGNNCKGQPSSLDKKKYFKSAIRHNKARIGYRSVNRVAGQSKKKDRLLGRKEREKPCMEKKRTLMPVYLCINVTAEAIRSSCNAASTAASPPPITTTAAPPYSAPSQSTHECRYLPVDGAVAF